LNASSGLCSLCIQQKGCSKSLNKNNIRALNLTKPSGCGNCARIAGVWEANKLEKKPLMKAIIEEKAWVAIGVEALIMQFGW